MPSYTSLASEEHPSYLDAEKLPGCATPSYPRLLPIDSTSTHTTDRRRRPRVSVFKEIDVDLMLDAQTLHAQRAAIDILTSRPTAWLLDQAQSSDSLQTDEESLDSPDGSRCSDDLEYARLENEWTTLWSTFSSSRLMMLAVTLIVVIPLLYESPLLGKAGPSIIGAKAGVVERSRLQNKDFVDGKLVTRQAVTDTNVCNRWSHQSALVNGTIYLYGGRTNTDPAQTSDTWNNDFLTIDVTKPWDISSPSLTGLPRPSGLPSVSNGYLWNSYDTLYLYGGEFSDRPITIPSAYSLWQYDIKGSTWTQQRNPRSSAGNNSDGGNSAVLGSAEGAGISVPEIGRGFYFAGHQDPYTTPGWAQSIPRIYLKSLLEFTFPGYTNDGVTDLAGGKLAGSAGVWRNITQGGIQDTALFPNRADGVIVYVPGYGVDGILVSMGGGTNESFVSLIIGSRFLKALLILSNSDANERDRCIRHCQLYMV